MNACTLFYVTVSVSGETSGGWRTNSGSSNVTGHSFPDIAPDSESEYSIWIEYTATGPGGSATDRIDITVSPDPRVDYVRPIDECIAAAGG